MTLKNMIHNFKIYSINKFKILLENVIISHLTKILVKLLSLCGIQITANITFILSIFVLLLLLTFIFWLVKFIIQRKKKLIKVHHKKFNSSSSSSSSSSTSSTSSNSSVTIPSYTESSCYCPDCNKN